MALTRRARALIWTPGLVAALFTLLTSHGNAVVRALTVIVAITMLGGFAVVIAESLAHSILGEIEDRGGQASTLSGKQIVSGLILVSAMWILWQFDRQEHNRDLIQCVDSRAVDLGTVKASVLVRSCLDEPE